MYFLAFELENKPENKLPPITWHDVPARNLLRWYNIIYAVVTSKATIIIYCTTQSFTLITMETKLDELLKSVKSLVEEQKQNKTETGVTRKRCLRKQQTEYAAGCEEAEASSDIRIQMQRQ